MEIEEAEDDVEAYIKIGDIFYNDDVIDDAGEFYQKAIALEPDSKEIRGKLDKIAKRKEVEQYLIWADSSWDTFNYNDAKEYWIHALSICKELKESEQVIYVFKNIADRYENAELYLDAIDIYKEILELEYSSRYGTERTQCCGQSPKDATCTFKIDGKFA